MLFIWHALIKKLPKPCDLGGWALRVLPFTQYKYTTFMKLLGQLHDNFLAVSFELVQRQRNTSSKSA